MELDAFFAQVPRAALAFSGGTDSAYLLYAAVHAGAQVQPYYIQSAFQPAFELRDARRLCAQLGVPLTVLPLDVLANAAVAANPSDRCYHCKRALFSALAARAAADGYGVLLDGTNASDDASDRPGMRALAELRVLSPLRLCGVTKREVRRRSRAAGLFTWDKPAYACLATRVPAGTPLTQEALHRVEQAENALFEMGFTDFRVRLLGDAARLQLPEAQLSKALACRQQLLDRLTPYFTAVLLDLVPRTAPKGDVL